MFDTRISHRHTSSSTMDVHQDQHQRRSREVADAARKRLEDAGTWKTEEDAEREVRRRTANKASYNE